MKAYLCLFLWLFNQNDVLVYSTSLGPFGQGSGGPIGIPMNGGTNQEMVVQAQGKSYPSTILKPIWGKNTEWLHDRNKPLISNNIGSQKGTEIKGTIGLSERSDNENDIVSNIGEARQPGSIFFNPYWTKQAKNTLYNDNNGFNNHVGNNGFNNHLGQNSIYTGGKGNQQSSMVQIGKGFKSQLWKPEYDGNKGSYNHPGHTPLSGSKGNKQSNNFQEVKSLYSLSSDTLNSNQLKGKKKVPLKVGNSIINSIRNFQSGNQNLNMSGMFSEDVGNNKWDKSISQIEEIDPVLEKIKKIYHKLNLINSYQHDNPNVLRHRIIYSKRDGPLKKQRGNQEIANWSLPELLRSVSNSSSSEKGNVADEPSETKTRVHPYRRKRRTNMNDSPSNENDEEGNPTGQILILNPNSENVGNPPVHHTLNIIDLRDIGLKTDSPLEMNTLKGGTITDKRVKPPKGHSWNQKDLYSGNIIDPAKNSLNMILAAKGLNMRYSGNLNTDHLGGINTNHPDEYSNGNPANDQNVDIERNIHYPDITGMKIVHPKDLLHYLRILNDIVPPSSTPPTGVIQVPIATTTPSHILSGKEDAKWGGITFKRGSPINGTRSRFMAFPLSRNVLRADGHNYTFHFGGILFWG